MAATASSNRRLAGEEDIPLQERPQHQTSQNGPNQGATEDLDALPSYSESVPPPAYAKQPATSTAAPLIKKSLWARHRRKWIVLVIGALIIIIAVAVGRVIAQQSENKLDGDSSLTIPPVNRGDGNPDSKVFALASAECEQGTFVVWKLETGGFWWSGQFLEGEWEGGDGGKVKPIAVPQDETRTWNYVAIPQGKVDITAVCYQHEFYNDTVVLSFVYQHPTRDFKHTMLYLNYLSANSTAGSSKVATYFDTIPGVPYYPVSLTSAYISSPSSSQGHHLFYTLPTSTTNTSGPASIIEIVHTIGGWGGPSSVSLNTTALNAQSGIQAASIDGGQRDDNATSIHLIYRNRLGSLVAMTWTEADDWGSPNDLFQPEVLQTLPLSFDPGTPLSLCIPSSNHTKYQMDLSANSSFTSGVNTQLYETDLTTTPFYFLSWIDPDDGSIKYISTPAPSTSSAELSEAEAFAPKTEIQTISLSANTSASLGNVTAIRASPFLSCSARRQVKLAMVNLIGPNYLTIGQQQEAIRWTERVELFYVDAYSDDGGTLQNLTWRRELGGAGPRWTLENLVNDVTDLDDTD